MASDWKKYFEQTKNKPPRSLLVEALPYVKNRKRALDLGSGALNDSIYLLKEGFEEVTAVDKEQVASEIAKILPEDKFKYHIINIEDCNFSLEYYDLINAQYSLPFVNPESFERVIKDIIGSLNLDGIFTGQFFGERDEWNGDPSMTFVTRQQAESLFSGIEIIKFEEEEKDSPTAMGDMKHWHIFHFIVRKK